MFKLTYAPYKVGEREVNETRVVSLDAGSNLNKITEHYGDVEGDLEMAVGFPYRGNDDYVMNAAEGYISYAEPEAADGILYLGVVADVSFVKTEIVQNQMVGVLNYQPSYLAGKGLTYYSGGGWNKGG